LCGSAKSSMSIHNADLDTQWSYFLGSKLRRICMSLGTNGSVKSWIYLKSAGDVAFSNIAKRPHQLLTFTDSGDGLLHRLFEPRNAFLPFADDHLKFTRCSNAVGKLTHGVM
jgi:hypothetical protein